MELLPTPTPSLVPADEPSLPADEPSLVAPIEPTPSVPSLDPPTIELFLAPNEAPKETPNEATTEKPSLAPNEAIKETPSLVPNEAINAPNETTKEEAAPKETTIAPSKESSDSEAATMKAKMDAFEKELSKVVGLHTLKAQLQNWAKQMLLDLKRRALGLQVGDRRAPHMAFLGNPGTGKTTVARMIGELLHMLGVIPDNKVVEVQRSDLVAKYVGQTAVKTRKKVEEAKGGVLFVDEAYRLMPGRGKFHDNDFGREALEEIMSFMDGGQVVVIFAGYHKKMWHVISANEGFRRRVTKYFHFDDFTCRDLAEMALLKMSNLGPKSPLYGFRLDPLCTAHSIEEMIGLESSEEQRKETNGGLVDLMLVNARENLDRRSNLDCEDMDSLVTITMSDLVAGLRVVKEHSHRKNTKKKDRETDASEDGPLAIGKEQKKTKLLTEK